MSLYPHLYHYLEQPLAWTPPSTVANEVSSFRKKLGALCFTACFYPQVESLRLGSGTGVVGNGTLFSEWHLCPRIWVLCGHEREGVGSTLRFSQLARPGVAPSPYEPGQGWSRSKHFRHSAPKAKPLFDGRKDPLPLKHITTCGGGQDEKCWCRALPGRKRLWQAALFLAAEVWCGVSIFWSWEWGEREQPWFRYLPFLPHLYRFVWIDVSSLAILP